MCVLGGDGRGWEGEFMFWCGMGGGERLGVRLVSTKSVALGCGEEVQSHGDDGSAGSQAERITS